MSQEGPVITPAVVNSGARLDRLPISRFHWRILALIGAGSFLDAFDIYLAGGVMAAMAREGFSDLATNAVFVSVTFMGMLIGSAFAGYVGDRFGRRYSYQVNLAIFGVASLAACFAPTIQILIALRFIMGLGLGAELIVAAGTLCEFVPPSHRGRWISLLGLIITSGLFVATTVGYFVIPNLGWRWMFAIAGVGAILVWALRKRMPESPRWLESVGRKDEAEQTLQAIEAEIAVDKGPLPPVDRIQSLEARPVPVWQLLDRKLIARTLVASLSFIATNMAVYGFVAWLPTFLVKQGLTVVQSLGYTTIMSFGGPAGALVGFLIADRMPRRWSIVFSCAATVIFAFVYLGMREPAAILIAGFALITSIYTLVVLVSYGYIPELFPTELRLRGTGVAYMSGRATSITVPYLIIFLFATYGLPGVLGLAIGLITLLAVAVLLLGVETGVGSLDQVQAAADVTAKAPDRVTLEKRKIE